MNITKKGEWMELQIPREWENSSIDFLLKEMWQIPRGLLHQIRMAKGVKVNGETIPWSKELTSGDKLQVLLFEKEEYGVTPTYMEIDVLYEDDHVLVVNKPAGMDTHPSDLEQTDTLANAVAYHFLMSGVETKIRHIHRLDKDTTGAILFAKHALAGATLDRQLEKREIKRTYVALVHGKLIHKKGEINESIGRDRHHPTRRRVSQTGQNALTHYESIHYDPKRDESLVKLSLLTGRTHQIRVHMSFIGHPLIGDKLYGGKGKVPRQALHAVHIAFPHPITNKQIQCTAPFLDDPPIFKIGLDELKLIQSR